MTRLILWWLRRLTYQKRTRALTRIFQGLGLSRSQTRNTVKMISIAITDRMVSTEAEK